MIQPQLTHFSLVLPDHTVLLQQIKQPAGSSPMSSFELQARIAASVNRAFGEEFFITPMKITPSRPAQPDQDRFAFSVRGVWRGAAASAAFSKQVNAMEQARGVGVQSAAFAVSVLEAECGFRPKEGDILTRSRDQERYRCLAPEPRGHGRIDIPLARLA
jgi:hypothetical protein